jgi:hypothetical protein
MRGWRPDDLSPAASVSQLDAVRRYVRGQEKHHRGPTFQINHQLTRLGGAFSMKRKEAAE